MVERRNVGFTSVVNNPHAATPCARKYQAVGSPAESDQPLKDEGRISCRKFSKGRVKV
jgi:hypothetical protein